MKSNIKKAVKLRRLKTDKNLPTHRLCKVIHCAPESACSYLRSNQSLQVKMPWKRSGVIPYELRPEIDEWIQERMKLPQNKRQYYVRYHAEMCEKYLVYKETVAIDVLTRYIKRREQIFLASRGHYLTLKHEPDEAQADFGRFFYLDGDGESQVGQIVALTFPASGVSYAQVLPGKSTEGFLVCMQNIFRHVGGVPRELWLDNDGSFVHLLFHNKRHNRILLPFFEMFLEHYGVTPLFMRVNKSHEKGAVEHAVGYLRSNLLVPYPVITDFVAYNKGLLSRSEQLYDRPHRRFGYNILESFRASLSCLNPLPPTFECETTIVKNPDAIGKMLLHGKAYYVPPEYYKQKLTCRLSYNRIFITTEDGAVVLDIPRLFGSTLQAGVD